MDQHLGLLLLLLTVLSVLLLVRKMATWTPVDKESGAVIEDSVNLLLVQTQADFSWDSSEGGGDGWEDTTDFTDAEHLQYVQSLGRLAPLVGGTESIWGPVDKNDTTWGAVAQNSDFGGGSFGGGGFGEGTTWTAVTKDS